MAFDVTKLAKLGHVQELANRVKKRIDAVEEKADAGFKKGIVDGNTVKFYKNAEAVNSDTADFSFDFAAESFLDQAQTTFNTNFTFSTATYGADTTDPNLDGKPVLTLAVKTVDAQSNTSINYSFINVEDLVDIYDVETDTTSQRVLSIANNKISFKLNADTDNALEATATGLKVNVTDKANRDTDATLHNVAYFDATGTPVDAGIASTDVVLTSAIATDAESNEMLQAIFPTVAGGGE